MILSLLLQVGIDDLIVTPELTTGVALLLCVTLFIPAYAAIQFKSSFVGIFFVFQLMSLMIVILLGQNLSIFWVVSIIAYIILGINMALYTATGARA